MTNSSSNHSDASPAPKPFAHPCDPWARTAGYDSWADALEAMSRGEILVGASPLAAKALLSAEAFMKEVRALGLYTYFSELGMLMLGFHQHFPKLVLETQESELQQLGEELERYGPDTRAQRLA